MCCCFLTHSVHTIASNNEFNNLWIVRYVCSFWQTTISDTVRYIYVRSKADKMASLVKRTARKQKIRKNYKQKSAVCDL